MQKRTESFSAFPLLADNYIRSFIPTNLASVGKNKTAKRHEMPLRVEAEETKCGMNFVKSLDNAAKKLQED